MKNVKMPDGKVIPNVAPGTPREELIRRWNEMKSFDPPGGALVSSEDQMRHDFGQSFGLPPEQIDFSNQVPMHQRGGIGMFSDTPQERRAVLETLYPNANIRESEGHFGIQQGPPGTPPLFDNPPGLDWGDAAEFAGNVGPSVAGTGAAVLASPGSPVLSAVAGAGAMEGVRQLGQYALGTQMETPPQVAGRVGMAAGMELIPGAGKLAKAGWRKLKGKGEDQLWNTLATANAKDLETAIQIFRDTGDIDLPALQMFQKSDNPLVAKIANQSMQFSDTAQQRRLAQLNGLGEVARNAAPETGQKISTDEIVQEGLVNYYNRMNRRLSPELNTGAAGQNVIDASRQGLDIRKGEMEDAYAHLDRVYKEEEPVFNLSQTIALAKPRKAMLEDIEGNPINMAAAPDSALAGIMQKISRLGDTQENYPAIKDVRTQLGQLLEMNPVALAESGMDIGHIKRLYGQLSEDMMSGTGSPAFEKAAKAAAAKAKPYYDTFDHPPVREVLTAEAGKTPTTLWDSMASNPVKWEDEMLDLLSVGSTVKGGEVYKLRNNLSRMLNDSTDPVGTLARWKNKNPQGLRRLFPREGELAALERNVKLSSELGKSLSKDAANATDVQVGFAMDAIQEHAKRMPKGLTNKNQHMANLVHTVGPDSHKALRNAVFTDTIKNSLAVHEGTGAFTLNPKKIEEAMQGLRDSGAWEGILSDRDRRALTTMRDYARRTHDSGAAGTGLAIASQVGQVRQGDLGALSSIAMSKIMANMLTDTKLPASGMFKVIPKSAGPLSAPVMDMLYRGVRQGGGDAIISGLYDPEDAEQQ